jgi:diguanylate cyclase (GGDEF)-like protein
MKVFTKTGMICLLVQLTFISFCQASEPTNLLNVESSGDKKDKLLHTPDINILPINSQLLALMEDLKVTHIDHYKAKITLAQLTLPEVSLNAAEQYLLLIAKAKLKENVSDSNVGEKNSNDIVALLEPAASLSETISKVQLASPDFLQLHLMLAEHYAKLGQYDLAYLEKKSYLKKYYLYRKNKRLAMIDSLEQSFEVTNKKANNTLMANQNELKIRRVAQVKDEKAMQQSNFTLIIIAAIIFVLLFFRQLRIRNKLIQLTQTDALTGLANRSVLFEHGEKMVSSFVEQPEEFSVLLLDIDHFKKINDNFGHHVGDETLKIVSQLVKETMRSRDEFSRLGGEEFVALLPFADNNKAKAIAMRINRKIAQYDFSSLMLQNRVTISIGVATMGVSHMSFDDLLHCADLAMHQAKDQGRDTVICYQNIATIQERRVNSNSSKEVTH